MSSLLINEHSSDSPWELAMMLPAHALHCCCTPFSSMLTWVATCTHPLDGFSHPLVICCCMASHDTCRKARTGMLLHIDLFFSFLIKENPQRVLKKHEKSRQSPGLVCFLLKIFFTFNSTSFFIQSICPRHLSNPISNNQNSNSKQQNTEKGCMTILLI